MLLKWVENSDLPVFLNYSLNLKKDVDLPDSAGYVKLQWRNHMVIASLMMVSLMRLYISESIVLWGECARFTITETHIS